MSGRMCVIALVSAGVFAYGCTVGGTGEMDGGTGDGFFACARNSDCPSPQVCRAATSGRKVCVPECRWDPDCCEDPSSPCGRVCRGERCVAGAPETCNGFDDDVDGETDEGFFLMSDAANCGRCGLRCDAALSHARRGRTQCVEGVCHLTDTSCADGFFNINGVDADGCEYACTVTNGSVEAPDNNDNDCDGTTDEGFACIASTARTCGLSDPTRHGVGICRSGIQACRDDGTWSPCTGAVMPTAESCNGGDEDCDGATDEDFLVGVECRGVGACGVGAYECASTSARRCSVDIGGSAYPTPAPIEMCDLVDNDCDGVVDRDADPSVVANDAFNCGACGVSCATPNTETRCVAGVCTITGCAAGFRLVGGACLQCDVWPTVAEACDAAFLDEDCDGSRNEGCVCVNGTTQPCGLDPALHGVGVCHFGTQTCAAGIFGTCTGAVAPATESCNGGDDDCDGVTDNGLDLSSDAANCGRCGLRCDDALAYARPGGTVCVNGACRLTAGGCADGFSNINGAEEDGCEYACFRTFNGTERCDGIDNDCDGMTDEASTCDPPRPNALMTFSVTLPVGFPVDATAMFCSTFVEGFWSCGGYPLTVTVDATTGATTITTEGNAIAGNHVCNLCSATCNTGAGTWVVTEDAGGFIVEAATPAMTYAGTARTTIPVPGGSGRGGGNWAASFPSP